MLVVWHKSLAMRNDRPPHLRNDRLRRNRPAQMGIAPSVGVVESFVDTGRLSLLPSVGPVLKVRRNGVELSSGAYHFELIEFRHLRLAGTQKWALNPLGLCPGPDPNYSSALARVYSSATSGVLLLPLRGTVKWVPASTLLYFTVLNRRMSRIVTS